MSAHIILNLLNSLRKSNEHFIAFSNEFNIPNNAGARMLDSIYHYVPKLLIDSVFA